METVSFIFAPLMQWKDFKYHFRKTYLLAYPVCLSQLGHVMVGVVDTAFVGQIGTVEQAAVSLANSVYIVFLVFGIGVSYGITPLVASMDTEKKYDDISSTLKNGLYINLVLGVILFLLLFSISPFFKYLNQPEDVLHNAIPFFNVMIFSLIPLSVFFTLKQFTEGLSLTKMAMVISIAGNVINIILNYILIFGKFGFAPMGVMGSCWATFISRVIMAVWMFLYVRYYQIFAIYWKDFSAKKILKNQMKKILDIGIPAGFQFVFEVGAFAFAAVMIGWIGSNELAAHQIALSLAAVTYMIASGISAAATVRVGNYVGLKDNIQVRNAGFSALLMVLGFMFSCALLFIVLRNILPHYFSLNQNVIELSSSLLVIAAFFQLSDGAQVVGLGILRGLKDAKIPTYITLFAYWIVALPVSYSLAFKFNMGIQGIWIGLLLGLTVAAFFLYYRFNRISKKIIS